MYMYQNTSFSVHCYSAFRYIYHVIYHSKMTQNTEPTFYILVSSYIRLCDNVNATWMSLLHCELC